MICFLFCLLHFNFHVRITIRGSIPLGDYHTQTEKINQSSNKPRPHFLSLSSSFFLIHQQLQLLLLLLPPIFSVCVCYKFDTKRYIEGRVSAARFLILFHNCLKSLGFALSLFYLLSFSDTKSLGLDCLGCIRVSKFWARKY